MQKDENEVASPSEVRWYKKQARKRRNRIIRWCIAILLMVSPLWLWIIWGPLIFLYPFFVVLGVLLVTFDIASFCSGWAEHIWWSWKATNPEPRHGIAQTLAARGKYAEAEAEYEKIIREFPDDVQSHIDMLNIAVVRLNDGELAEKLFQRGMSFLKEPEARESLRKAYDRIRSRLKKTEEMKNTVVSAEKMTKARDHFERVRQKLWR